MCRQPGKFQTSGSLRALAERFGDSPTRRILSIPHALRASLAYGFWLAALRHEESGAAAITQGFVAGI